MSAQVSSRFRPTVYTAGGEALSVVTITDSSGSPLWTSNEVVSGTITEDSTRPVRWSGDFTFVGTDLDPRDVDDLLSVVGNEIHPYRGVQYADGTQELMPLGALLIAESNVEVSEQGPVISVSCYDRSWRITRAGLDDTWVMPVGADLAAVASTFLSDRWAGGPQLISPVSEVIEGGAVWLPGSGDGWSLLRDFVAAYGCEIFYDDVGQPQLRYLPDPTRGTPEWEYRGGFAAVVTKATRILQADGSYSGVQVIGTSNDGATPVVSEQWDTTPGSPTNSDGPFGRVPYPFQSSVIASQGAADNAAIRLLPKWTGVVRQASWSSLVDPSLRCADLVDNTDDATGLSGTYSLEAVTWPLGPDGTMDSRVKERRVRS